MLLVMSNADSHVTWYVDASPPPVELYVCLSAQLAVRALRSASMASVMGDGAPWGCICRVVDAPSSF
jgi:hypothetical protein